MEVFYSRTDQFIKVLINTSVISVVKHTSVICVVNRFYEYKINQDYNYFKIVEIYLRNSFTFYYKITRF